MKVATHLVFAECCWFAASAVFDVHYEDPGGLRRGGILAPARRRLPEELARPPAGKRLGGAQPLLRPPQLPPLLAGLAARHRDPGRALVVAHRTTRPHSVAVFVGYGSHLLADMMTLGGVQLFWPSRLIAVFPGRDEYRVVSGSGSEAVFVAVVFVLALLFYPVSGRASTA